MSNERSPRASCWTTMGTSGMCNLRLRNRWVASVAYVQPSRLLEARAPVRPRDRPPRRARARLGADHRARPSSRSGSPTRSSSSPRRAATCASAWRTARSARAWSRRSSPERRLRFRWDDGDRRPVARRVDARRALEGGTRLVVVERAPPWSPAQPRGRGRWPRCRPGLVCAWPERPRRLAAGRRGDERSTRCSPRSPTPPGAR